MDNIEEIIKKEIADLDARKRALVAALRALNSQIDDYASNERSTDKPPRRKSSLRPKELGVPFLTKKILRQLEGQELPFSELITRIQLQKPTSPESSIRSGIHREAKRGTVKIESGKVRLT